MYHRCGACSYIPKPKQKPNPIVFFDVSIDGRDIGRVIFELYAHIAPQTAENFRLLCTGDNFYNYKGSFIHRIIPNFMIHAGDFRKADGRGGFSALPMPVFDDENFDIDHSRPGLLSMANTEGPNTNGSQFFITLGRCPWLDERHVVFGEVIKGYDHVIRNIERKGSRDGTPTSVVVIRDCGEMKDGLDKIKWYWSWDSNRY